MKVEAVGYIENGKPHVYNASKFWDAVRTLAKKQKRTYITITATRQYKQRSSPQNRYYYGVIIGMPAKHIEANNLFDYERTNENGITETVHPNFDETCKILHYQLKMRFHYRDIVNPNTGEIDRVPLSTKDFKTIEFEQYAERCRRFILEWYKLNLPLPNEQADLFLE